MNRYGKHADLGIADLLEYVGSCTAPGRLIDLGEWPGAVGGNGAIHGELWRIRDFRLFKILDPVERFDPMHPDESHYERKVVSLASPKGVDAWIYYLQDPSGHVDIIDSGDWGEYEAARNSRMPKIRLASKEDTEALRLFAVKHTEGAAFAPETWEALISEGTGSGHAFVATHGDQIVGATIWQCGRTTSGTLHLKFIAVGSEFQGGDLPDRLLQRVAEWARLNNLGSIEALANSTNENTKEALKQLASRLGSSLIETLGSEGTHDSDAVLQIPWTGIPGQRQPNLD